MTSPPDRLVVLVRHADAVARSGWADDDGARPLTAKGERQAAALAGDLADPAPGRLVSSPARRCTDTLAPLAARAGRPLEHAAPLAEGADPDEALAYLLELASAPGAGPVVACSHGDVVDGLVHRLLADRARLEAPDGRPVTLGTPKAARWSLAVVGGTVVGGALQPPPGERPRVG